MSSIIEHTHATEGNLHHTEEHHGPHVMDWKVLVAVWIALMICTAITIGAAYLPLHSDFWRATIAIAVATVKASIVALFFMHLLYDEKFNLVVFVASILFVVVFFAFTLMDPLTRGWVNPISEFPTAPNMDRPGTMVFEFHKGLEGQAADQATTGTAATTPDAAAPAAAPMAASGEHAAPAAPPHAEAPAH